MTLFHQTNDNIACKTMLNLFIILFVHSLQSWGLNLDFVLTGEAIYH